MKISTSVALVTGAASGIGRALILALAKEKIAALAVVDSTESVLEVAKEADAIAGAPIATPFCGDLGDSEFRARVYDTFSKKCGPVTLCVPLPSAAPLAGAKTSITTNPQTIYPDEHFIQIVENNLLNPIHWASEAAAALRCNLGVKTKPRTAMIVLLGSVDSKGNQGKLDHAATAAGLKKAASTLSKASRLHGVHCVVIHPSYIDTPFTQALGPEHISDRVIPNTLARRPIPHEEVAEAICQMISSEDAAGFA